MSAPAIVVDDVKLLAWLGRLSRTVGDLTPVMRAIGAAVTDNTRLRFRESKAPDGSTWRPLSPVTIAKRRKSSSTPLMDTGRLRNSITFRADARSATIGTNVVYAAVQQFGARQGEFGRTKRNGPIPWGNIPERPFLGISQEDSDEAIEIIRDAILREVRT